MDSIALNVVIAIVFGASGAVAAYYGGRLADRNRADDADNAERKERHGLSRAVERLSTLLEQYAKDQKRVEAEIEKRGERHHDLANIVQGNMRQIDRNLQAATALRNDLNGFGARVTAAERMAEQALAHSLACATRAGKGNT